MGGLSEKGAKIARILPPNSVLVSCIGILGKTGFNKIPIAFNQQINAIIFNEGVFSKYGFYYSQTLKEWMHKTASATTLPIINKSKFSKAPFPLPPLPEQHRIVTKIEELFTRLDAGVEALKKVKAELKRYRQSVLKAAMEGGLTEEWREMHKEGLEPASVLLERIKEERKKKLGKKYKEPATPNIETLPNLPNGWSWATLEQLSSHIVDCLHSTPKFTSGGKYCIDTTCIEFGKVLFEKARFVSGETYKERVQRLVPEVGDILFAREGTIGTAVVVPDNVELCLGQRMMMFRPENYISSKYFMYTMGSRVFERQWKPKVTGTTSPHVNIRDLRLMSLPFPPRQEQNKIVEEIEHRLSVTDETEKAVDQSIKRAERLRQSILKKAFEGKLVPQDPDDEPAGVLLERIKAEKAKRDAEGKARKKVKKAVRMRLR